MKDGSWALDHSLLWKLLKEGLKGVLMLWSGVARAWSVVLVLERMQVDQGCSMPDRQLLA